MDGLFPFKLNYTLNQLICFGINSKYKKKNQLTLKLTDQKYALPTHTLATKQKISIKENLDLIE
jgi:hypothetical protein